MSKKRRIIRWIARRLSELRAGANKIPSEAMAKALEAIEKNRAPNEKNNAIPKGERHE